MTTICIATDRTLKLHRAWRLQLLLNRQAHPPQLSIAQALSFGDIVLMSLMRGVKLV
jgi:hypothetical protein